MADTAGATGATGSTGAPGTTAASGSAIATAPAAATGTAAPTTSVVKATPGDTVTAKIHALHAAHFAGTPLANHTELWNMVMSFKADVIALVEEAYADAKAKL